jgi:hypothetical protein
MGIAHQSYPTLVPPGANCFRDAQTALAAAVRAAYRMTEKRGLLPFLLRLNLTFAESEAKGETITPPGLSPSIAHRDGWISENCITSPPQ